MALEARLGQRLARGMMIHQSGASGAVRSRAPTAGVASGALLGEREQRGVWLNDDVVSNYESGALRYREQRVEVEDDIVASVVVTIITIAIVTVVV